MGMYRNTYIGPWAIVSLEKYKVNEKFTLNSCSNNSCKSHGKKSDTKFCGECGSECKEQEFTREKERTFNIWDFNHEIGKTDLFNQVDEEYCKLPKNSVGLLLNQKTKYSLDFDDESGDTLDLLEINPIDILEQFKTQYADYFKVLGYAIGYDKITYGFGLMVYYR